MDKQCKVCNRQMKNRGNVCISCIANLRRISVKEELVKYKGSKCEVCGYNRCMRALTFHHINPNEKDFNISGSHCRKLKTLKKEVDKCQLLCHNCHNEIHEKLDLTTSQLYLQRYEYYKKKQKNVFVCQTCGSALKRKQKQCGNCYKSRIKYPSKEELQALIWQKPTTHIAKQFGVSDKAVEKWCKKYEINKPPRGYWAKRSKS